MFIIVQKGGEELTMATLSSIRCRKAQERVEWAAIEFKIVPRLMVGPESSFFGTSHMFLSRSFICEEN